MRADVIEEPSVKDSAQGSLEARRGVGVGVNVLGDNVGIDVLEHLGSSFLGPSFLELREAIGDAREEVFAGAGPAVAAAHVWFACSG